jgi:hypothetical protein
MTKFRCVSLFLLSIATHFYGTHLSREEFRQVVHLRYEFQHDFGRVRADREISVAFLEVIFVALGVFDAEIKGLF